MRVALFTDTYLPDVNGVVTSIELLRKELEKHGHDAYVVCTYPGVMKIKQEGKIIRLPGIEVKQLYGYALASPIHYLFIDDLKKLNFDIIHVHTEFGVGIFAGIVAKQLHIPLVRTYHTTYEDYTHYINFTHLESVDKLAKKAIVLLSKIYGDACMELIAPSSKTRDLLIKYGIKTPISVIPTGIELDHFQKANTSLSRIKEIRESCHIKDDERMLLYVGRIAQEKSLSLIIETFVEVKKRGLKLKLVIVGAGPQLAELEKMVKDLDIEEYITIIGKVPFAEVPAYYHSADAFISASTSETQGMTYIEALASGLLVFARHDEVIEDIVKDNENGFLFNDRDDLLAKFEYYLKLDDATIKSMIAKSEKVNEIYDADLFGEKIIALYEKAIKEYAQNFTISKVRLKNDYVILDLKNNDAEDEKVYVDLDRYYAMGLRKQERLTYRQYDEIKQKEKTILAYRAALKVLANRDYTVKEMYDYLNKHYELPIGELNAIIDRLSAKGLLDDYRYATDKLAIYDKALYSKQKIIYTLKKAGVPLKIIDNLLIQQDNSDSELAKAKEVAEKYRNQIKGKSLRMKKQLIIKKLLREGYSMDTANEVLNVLSFRDETFEEKDILRKEAYKAKTRFARKYSGSNLRNRIYHALVSKGFDIDAVYAILNEMEWDDEKD